jgi:hypothetical protein
VRTGAWIAPWIGAAAWGKSRIRNKLSRAGLELLITVHIPAFNIWAVVSTNPRTAHVVNG